MVKVAILSFEHMHAYGYAHALREIPEAEFTAFADEEPKRRKEISRLYPEAKAYAHWQGLLASAACDAVIVTSANGRHRQMVLAAAKRGKHILCEKPIATTLKDARAMLKAAEASGVKFQTAFPVRFTPAVERGKKIINSGALGKILAINTTNRGTMPGGWFVDKKLAGGGAIMDHTVHVVDLLRYLLRKEVTQVYAEMSTRLYPIKTEDCGLIMMELEGGIFATLDCSWSRPASYKVWGDVIMEFTGRQANLHLDCFAPVIDVYRDKDKKHSCHTTGGDCDRRLIHDFVNCILKDKPPSITGYDGLKAVEVTLAAYQSIREKKPVSLPLE